MRDECEFWTWNSPSYPSSPLSCWLKSSNETKKLKEGKISGPKFCDFRMNNNDTKEDTLMLVKENLSENDIITENYTAVQAKNQNLSNCFLENTSFLGFGIENNQVEDIQKAEACQEECRKRDECLYWTWNGPEFQVNPLRCYLKSSNKNYLSKKGKVSGPKECESRSQRNADINNCIEYDKNFAGNGIPNNQINDVSSPEDCQKECSLRVGCFYWTWNSHQASRFPETCWLKSRLGNKNPKEAENKVSGPVSCEGSNLTEKQIQFYDLYAGLKIQLFDLGNDQDEKNNIAQEKLDVAQSMISRLNGEFDLNYFNNMKFNNC